MRKLILLACFAVAIGCKKDDAENRPSPTADFELKGLRLTSVDPSRHNSITSINLSTNADTYTWDFGDGSGPQMGGVHSYLNSGTYTVTLTASQFEGKGDATKSKQITIYAVGQKLYGGIIFYADSVGKCLVASEADIPDLHNWGCPTTATNIKDQSFFSGKTNSAKIVAQCGNSTAAYQCEALVNNGYDDWYLPSRKELTELYLNQYKVNGLSNISKYWSSTEYDADNAIAVDFNRDPAIYHNFGYADAIKKLNTSKLRVRAIRAN